MYPGAAKNHHLQRHSELQRAAAGRAREWKLFEEQALNVEVILMRSAAAAAALVSGDLDYQSGIGPAVEVAKELGYKVP